MIISKDVDFLLKSFHLKNEVKLVRGGEMRERSSNPEFFSPGICVNENGNVIYVAFKNVGSFLDLSCGLGFHYIHNLLTIGLGVELGWAYLFK